MTVAAATTPSDSKMSTEATTAQSSVRYECFLTLLNKALSESRKSFDTAKAVKDCYGEDASMFDDNMLVTVIDGMIDKVNDRVKEEMLQILQEKNVRVTLQNLEGILAQLDEAEKAVKQAEQEDQQSARDALETVRLPKDVTPQNVLSYHAFEVMQKERDDLIEELEKVQAETKELEQQQANAKAVVQERVQKIETVAKELERSADMCSMVS
jgi:hypothetical protein